MKRRTAQPLLRSPEGKPGTSESEEGGVPVVELSLALAQPDTRARRVWVEVRAVDGGSVLHEVAGNHVLPATLMVEAAVDLPARIELTLGLGPTSDTPGYRIERCVPVGERLSVVFGPDDALPTASPPPRPVYANTKGSQHYQAPGDDT